MTYSVNDEPDYARTYVEDEIVHVRKGDLRALLDAVRGSLDFGSGFLCNEEVESMRAAAVILGVDPDEVTPNNFHCTYIGHDFFWMTPQVSNNPPHWHCRYCGARDHDTPPPLETQPLQGPVPTMFHRVETSRAVLL